ncbi:unnamed protein product [Cladocopium goreaui]|uniref:Probable plastid-lipid-associated protein 10, chloroplastic (Fibrillin-8) n=1 Tax=Cladocopium goreaui TaxID=2562237 RepID=A0A9P1FW18_9DINO|nr:unnamed protein product [Cladocopium goreaui]
MSRKSRAQGEKSQRLAAKEALLEGIKSVDRGFSATEEQRSMIREKIDELVRWNPSLEPAKKLGGEWTLIYTNAPDILNIPTTPFSSIGRIGQEIDSTKGIIANVIEYRPSSLASGLKEAATEDALVQRVYTEYTVTSENSVELQIRGLGVDPQRVFGFEVPEALKLKVQGPLSLPFGNFEVLYLDEEDELLLRALQSLRDGILRQAEDTEKQLLASSQRAEAVGLKLRAANCHLEVLAQSQFLEHRIQTEEEEVDPTAFTEDLWSSCLVEPVPEVELDAIKKALSLGQNFVENQVIEEMPPLPPVIGSEAWQNSFIRNVEDFLGETETPAVAASPATEEVEEEAAW